MTQGNFSVRGYFGASFGTLDFEFPAMNPTRPGGDIRDIRSIGFFSEASMRKYGFALLVAAAAAVSAADAASAATLYDGRWSVVIQTTRGNCDQAYRYGLAIINGNVTYDGSGGFDVRGRVGAGGAVHVRVSSGKSYADGSGRLSRSSGSGVWRGVGNGVCSGNWVAEKR
jgi:hypothetical protein